MISLFIKFVTFDTFAITYATTHIRTREAKIVNDRVFDETVGAEIKRIFKNLVHNYAKERIVMNFEPYFEACTL
jgi:hypothetical protein